MDKNYYACREKVDEYLAIYPDNPSLLRLHINLLDKTVEGVECASDYAFSVQYHPESAPGPQDSSYLFDMFIDNMKKFKEEN